MAKNFGLHAQRAGIIETTRAFKKKFGGTKIKNQNKDGSKKNSCFVLRLKGSQKHAVKGLIDGGFRFNRVVEIKNPSFNGCRNKKTRRR